MTNMSHCKFENTYRDLADCSDTLFDFDSLENILKSVNNYEKPYVKKLIALCSEIHKEYGDKNYDHI